MANALPSPVIQLRSGVLIPQLGYGTYKVAPPDAYRAVREALEVGYRHIDTAEMYGNEAQVGAAIADSGLPRDEVFITSKLNNPYHEPQAAREAFAKTLDDLRIEQIDLFLIHWPMAKTTNYVETWQTMLEFEADGRCRAVGTSNFQEHHLRAIIDATGVAPALNQVELHPYLAQRPLVGLHAELGIVTASWSPLARGVLLQDPVVCELAEQVGRTAAQVVIRWHLQHGLVVIPKSAHRERMIQNADVFDFELSAQQMASLDALDRNRRVGSHPDRVELGDR
ncbi:MAG: aldo/keto reductase [Acidobacteriota bacterium]|nr:aldo/keto reductase [Acidobacteriota bacterium]NLI84625.1 aldo/keto reductase [Propionibacterium sp.]